MTTSTKRRRITVEDKLRILEEAQQPGVQVADLCRRHGISTSQFYGWRERAREGAKAALSQLPGRKGKARAPSDLERLRAERDRWKGVAAELTAENLELRKNG
jgi:transposase-like protein